MPVFNLKKNLNKKSQVVIHEKMLNKNRSDRDAKANDDTGNIDWLLKDIRKNSKDNTIQEKRLDKEHTKENDNPILEGKLNTAKNTLNKLRIDEKDTVPVMDIDKSYDIKMDKIFHDASEKVEAKDTALWDKYIGVQLSGKKTTIIENNQPSQLLSNFDSREEMNKTNSPIKKASVLEQIKDADAMLYFIYRTAAGQERELTEEEKQQITDINSGKIRLLAQTKPESEMTEKEREQEDRFEKSVFVGEKKEEEEEEEDK